MTHKEKITEALTVMDQPLTRLEIASTIGTTADRIKSQLDELAAAGKISVRQETTKERKVRLGERTILKGRPANLYAVGDVVPRRTVAALVEGNMSNPVQQVPQAPPATDPIEAFINTGQNVHERRTKVGRVHEAMTATFRTALQVAGVAKVSDTFARDVLAVLVEAGEVEAEKLPGKRGLRYRLARVLPVEAPVDVAPQVSPVIEVGTPEAAASPAVELVRSLMRDSERVADLEVEIERLEQVAYELSLENAELKARLEKISSLVA